MKIIIASYIAAFASAANFGMWQRDLCAGTFVFMLLVFIINIAVMFRWPV